ncbi:MAG: threonylcarbamoyl-AMP synthase [Clostridia bacterium]|nr:threonylcarbamoyl-AMP synthase [Clostridia bacterium]
MKTILIKVNPDDPSKEALAPAAEILKKGGTVVFPTETVYGLGGDATHSESAEKIYAAKGRPSDNPLIIHISDPDDVEPYAVTSKLWCRLARHFMPGPLTVILPKKDTIPTTVTGGLDSVAVRCPAHPVALKLLELTGLPVAAPSANISGKPSPTCAEHVIEDLDGRVDCIIDGGECTFGVESTIVKITGEDSLILLRPGAVTYDALCCVCSDVTVSDNVMNQLKENERPICPGSKYRHYAPDKPLTLVGGSDAARVDFFAEKQKEGAVIICYDEQAEHLPADRVITIGKKDDLEAQGHRLFAALRECNSLEGLCVYANLPSTDGFGLALYNRLIRAAAHTVVYPDEL